jgi:hypothetical protein
MIFPRFAQSAVAFLLLTLGLAAPGHAQQNKQIISGTWYEDRAFNNNSASVLTMTFTQTPSDQFLNVTNVSCSVEVAPAQAMSTINLVAGTISGNDDLGRPYPLKGNTTPEIAGPSKFYSIVTNQIYFKFGPGRFPSIVINTESSGTFLTSAACVIVGNLTDN